MAPTSPRPATTRPNGYSVSRPRAASAPSVTRPRADAAARVRTNAAPNATLSSAARLYWRVDATVSATAGSDAQTATVAQAATVEPTRWRVRRHSTIPVSACRTRLSAGPVHRSMPTSNDQTCSSQKYTGGWMSW